MKKYIKIMLILLSFLPSFALAKECNWSEKSVKKSLANNISWSYEYYLKNNKMYFDITVSNVYEDLYLQPNRKNCALLPSKAIIKIINK